MGDLALAELIVSSQASIRDALSALEAGEQGIVFVCDGAGRVLGTLTDGDIRRALIRGTALDGDGLSAAMNREFVSVPPAADRAHVLDLMLARNIQQVPVLDERGRLIGLHTMRRIVGAPPRRNRAVIMAGGRGTRLGAITDNLPKPMVRVAGRPILERLILHLVGHGIRQIYLSVNYLSNVIEEHFGDGSRFGCAITYLREEQPLGSGGALSLVPKQTAEPLIVMNGDLVTQLDVGRFLDFHERGGYTATMGLHGHAVELPYGVAVVRGHDLIGLKEKPTERFLVNAGVYAISPEALAYVPAGEAYPITELFRACLSNGRRVGAYFIEDDWLDVGRPRDLSQANGH